MPTSTPLPDATAAGAPARASLAGYRIEHALARGGLGQVYAAIDTAGRRVALKVFNLADDDSGDIAAAFERESSLALRLDHPCIVRTIAAGREGRAAYLVMEFVPGGDFTPHTSPGGLLPWPAVIGIGRGVAEALDHAHRLGIVHRDIKPSNVLVHPQSGVVKLADFGLARLGDVFRSRTGVLAGTPSYMSPEQLSAGAVDARADIYSLGVVLFQALSAQLPHEAPSLGALLRKVASERAPDLRRLRPELPATLATLVSRMLATDPAARPARSREVADELAAITGALPPS